MKTNAIVGIVILALVAVAIYNPSILQYGPPTAFAVHVIDNNRAGIGGAICYVNPSGSSACMNSNPNSNECQWKLTSGSDGMCTFNAPWNASLAYTIGVLCPASFNSKTVTQVVNPRSGSLPVEILCGTGLGGQGNTSVPGMFSCPSAGELSPKLFSQESVNIGVVKSGKKPDGTIGYVQSTVTETHCVISSLSKTECLSHGLRWGGDTISEDGKSVIRGGGDPQRCFGALVQETVGYDAPLTADDKKGPLCLMEIYPDEFCSDFNYGTKYYSYYDTLSSGRKRCATQPGYDWGTCSAFSAAPTGDLCVQNPTYSTPNICKSTYEKDGGYCCIAPITPETEYGDCSKFPGSHKVMTDGVPSCTKDLNLIQGNCVKGTKQTIDGVDYCVVEADVKNVGADSITKTITNTITSTNSDVWAIILAFAGGGLVMYLLNGGRFGR